MELTMDVFFEFIFYLSGVIIMVYKYAKKHILLSSVLVLVIVIAIAIVVSYIMTQQSIKYEPLNTLNQLGATTIQKNVSLNYVKSTGYTESVDLPSILMDQVGEVNESINDFNQFNQVFSVLNEANGKTGTLTIPQGASDYSSFDFNLYGWKEEYKMCFDLFPQTDTEIVFVSNNNALEGRIDLGPLSGFLTGVTAYQLQ
jgi:hypothetical protein